jgi:Helix-turn-helix domain
MESKFAKVNEIADRFRVSADAVYLWIRQGKIPPACVARIAGTVRVDAEEFDRRLRAGELYRPRRKKTADLALHSREAAAGLGFSEDQHTTRLEKGQYHHRFSSEDGAVAPDHPYSGEMKATTH